MMVKQGTELLNGSTAAGPAPPVPAKGSGAGAPQAWSILMANQALVEKLPGSNSGCAGPASGRERVGGGVCA